MTEPCPKCQSPLSKNGVYKGRQRVRCRVCGFSCTIGGSIVGSLPRYGDTAQTDADRAKRYRDKKKDAKNDDRTNGDTK